MPVLVTGAAGFIGFHVARALLARGETVIGVDNLSEYYDVKLKEARLALLQAQKNFRFHKLNIADKTAMLELAAANADITHVVHLAAQAGVRYSLINPYAYVESNVMGQVVMLEFALHLPKLKHFVYASSSSVYGGNTKTPFAVEDPVEKPISIYAATKRSGELMAWTYAHLYHLPCTGLRFFTVYGPWGRPDMAAYIFTRQILAGEPIRVFNHGKMRRDFTFIDDIITGVLAVMERPPVDEGGTPPARLYNLGNSHAENLMDFVAALEKALGKKVEYDFQPMQPGDVPETFADIAASTRDFDYQPKTVISEGVPRFVEWYREYHKA
ncbi:MAG: NAD-dependent epimerase/dehydratase family protein [Alphaproteobacteria bacterium]|nr:NAD-dependent epimerase/dehydratase family protein [Alphaproteobacteria bacterium]